MLTCEKKLRRPLLVRNFLRPLIFESGLEGTNGDKNGSADQVMRPQAGLASR